MIFSTNRPFRLLFIFLTVTISSCHLTGLAKTSQQPFDRVDPPNWWIGMKEQTVELLFQGPNIQNYSVSVEGINTKITQITRPSNTSYLFVTIHIGSNQETGDLKFIFTGEHKKKFTYAYPLLQKNAAHTRGIDASDLIYLVFPDRFANGDTTNDVFAKMNEPNIDRQGLKSRHGGDLQGLINHLDYIHELGTTAIWVNPVLENNQPKESYHGYAFTDLYKIDPRLGNNALYKNFVDSCHKHGTQVIWDAVFNHWGNEHHLFKNLPDSSWIHWFGQFTRTNYRAETLMDPYASEADKKIMSNAWFDHHMPDLNQQSPTLARYLIQNSLWWIEYAGIDAFRIDTYAYPDQEFMAQLNTAIRREYPDFTLFGETWVQGSNVQAWFTENSPISASFNSYLHGVTDFQLYYAITKGLNENFGWEEGFRRIELTLGHDHLYFQPNQNVTFLDNHDLSRIYSVLGEDIRKWKMAVAMMYTLRGIPSIYYGTEILMKNFSDPDAKVREDFPGGWAKDKTNKFVPNGRTKEENEAFDFIKTLGNWRKQNSWLGTAKLTQFVPENNTYVYFRTDGEHLLMAIYNGNSTTTPLDLKRFSECLQGLSVGKDILSNQRIHLEDKIELAPQTFYLYDMTR
jgi:neopullulanase